MSESDFSERIKLTVTRFDAESSQRMHKEQNDAVDLAKRQRRLQEILAKKAEVRPQIARLIREDAKQAAKHYPLSTRDSLNAIEIRVPIVKVEPEPRGLFQFLRLRGQSPDRTVNITTREPMSLWFLKSQVIERTSASLNESRYNQVQSSTTYLAIVVNNNGDLLSCEKKVAGHSSVDSSAPSLRGYSGYRPTTDAELVPQSSVPASMSEEDTLPLLQAWQSLLLTPIDTAKSH